MGSVSVWTGFNTLFLMWKIPVRRCDPTALLDELGLTETGDRLDHIQDLRYANSHVRYAYAAHNAICQISFAIREPKKEKL